MLICEAKIDGTERVYRQLIIMVPKGYTDNS